MNKIKKIVILGPRAENFINFNVCYRDDPSVEVVAFTAAKFPA